MLLGGRSTHAKSGDAQAAVPFEGRRSDVEVSQYHTALYNQYTFEASRELLMKYTR